MNNSTHTNSTERPGPTRYRIMIAGRLSEKWAERMGGMTVTPVIGPESKPCTELYGPVQDAAALSGILNSLYDLRLQLLSVEALDPIDHSNN